MASCDDHTMQPESYVAWFYWAERMSKTHHQIRCKGCGLFEIWVPKGFAAKTAAAEAERVRADAKEGSQ